MRSYRKADPDEGKEAMERYRYRRWSRSRTDDDGMVLVSARLAPEDAAVVLAAVEAAREAAWRAARSAWLVALPWSASCSGPTARSSRPGAAARGPRS